jgi:hypothetical protein
VRTSVNIRFLQRVLVSLESIIGIGIDKSIIHLNKRLIPVRRQVLEFLHIGNILIFPIIVHLLRPVGVCLPPAIIVVYLILIAVPLVLVPKGPELFFVIPRVVDV